MDEMKMSYRLFNGSLFYCFFLAFIFTCYYFHRWIIAVHMNVLNECLKNTTFYRQRRLYSLCPESSENIPILFQGADLYFSNQNDLRNPKMGSKQSVVVPPYFWFFQKTVFQQKKMSKKLDILLIFEFLWQYIWTN